MTTCYQLADKYDDDFFKANARIEAATTLVLGASGLIGYKLSNGESAHVTRNIETKEENSARPMPTTGQLEALRKEKHRVEGGIPATRIE
jgi:hypothetical protein